MRTLSDLLEDHPELEHQKNWQKFAEEFDKEECIKERRKVMSAYRPKQGEQALHLMQLCHIITSDLAAFRRAEESPLDLWSKTRIDAALELTRKVMECFENTDEGKSLRNAMRAVAEKKRSPEPRRDKASPASSVLFAFKKFVDRERRLPTKKELNIESNRLRKCVKMGNRERQFGEQFNENGNELVFYDSIITDLDRDADDKIINTWKFRAVPLASWNEPQWEASSMLAEYSTPLGLKGLSEAHGDKGKRSKRLGKTRST